MQPRDLVSGIPEPAFAVDLTGRIVAWNDACSRLLGHAAAAVTGRSCCDLLRGRDVHGNPYCLTTCAARELAGQGGTVHDFPLDLQTAEGATVRVMIHVEVRPASDRGGPLALHRLQPTSGHVHAGPPDTGSRADFSLTRRELEVLRLLCDGDDARRVADRLFISLATARTHIQHILTKMDAHSQAQAVALALRRGLA